MNDKTSSNSWMQVVAVSVISFVVGGLYYMAEIEERVKEAKIQYLKDKNKQLHASKYVVVSKTEPIICYPRRSTLSSYGGGCLLESDIYEMPENVIEVESFFVKDNYAFEADGLCLDSEYSYKLAKTVCTHYVENEHLVINRLPVEFEDNSEHKNLPCCISRSSNYGIYYGEISSIKGYIDVSRLSQEMVDKAKVDLTVYNEQQRKEAELKKEQQRKEAELKAAQDLGFSSVEEQKAHEAKFQAWLKAKVSE